MLARTRTQAEPVTLGELLALWHGDDEVSGWASPTLALHIAFKINPESAEDLKRRIYYKDPETPIDFALVNIIRRGYSLYQARK